MATHEQNERLRLEAELSKARQRVVARVVDAYREQPRAFQGVLMTSWNAVEESFPGLPFDIMSEAHSIVSLEDKEKRKADVDRWILDQERAA